MTTIQLQPPRGWKANIWRVPIWLYRLGLGGLFGKRFLLLNHIGRVSGQPRQAVLEIVAFDAQTNTYYVVSGFGEKAQWFQNVMKMPKVNIQVGYQKVSAHAQRLPIDDGERIFQDYSQNHPTALRELTRIINIPYDGNPESIREMAKVLPVIAFHVAEGDSDF